MRVPAIFLLVLSASAATPRQDAAADRVVSRVDRTRRVSIPGRPPAWANPQTDAGALPEDFTIRHAAIVLARSPERQRAFENLLRRQQEPGSSDYHRWLTPVEVGERFGVSTNDIAAVTGWLASEGLHVESVSNSRVRIAFGGTAAAVGGAFGARMHQYAVGGERRFSIASEPSIPAALAPVVRAVSGLYTVKLNPMLRGGPASLGPAPAGSFSCSGGACSHYVFPSDFATIYDLNSVYSSGIDGAGQTIAIVGRSRVDNADIESFQQLSGLPVRDPTVIVPLNGSDPGPPLTSQGNFSDDQLEATLDVTRASGVAPGATILLVISSNDVTAPGGGLHVAAEYVIDTSPVPAQIMNISFGGCENVLGEAGVALEDSLYSQAAAEGISIFVCSGDSGAAGCDLYFATPPASQTLNTNGFCSSSYATCVGGTEFADASNPGQYWYSTNGVNYESAFGYIPEGAWNEPFTNSSSTQTSQSGGGVSEFIATPPWQAGIAPGYQGRYTPDVSFTSSAHDGYFACFAAGGNPCSGQGQSLHFEYFYGTSAAAPDMAGIAALINQKEGSPQGNLNPALYRLSVTAPQVFHDVTVASSGVANCDVNIPSMCNNSVPSPFGLTGGLAGFLVGPGYDEATGLGSIDVASLLANWASATAPLPTTTTALSSSANPAVVGTLVTLTASVTSSDSTSPQGTVSFADGGAPLATEILNASGSAAYGTASLAAGAHSIMAVYGGDATHAGSTSAALMQIVNPQGCTLGLSSPSANFPAGGGNGAVNVTAGAGCFWAASSPVGWVTFAGPASGSGNGVVNYTVAADNGSARSGTLTIAGLPFNVEQLGTSTGGLLFVPATPCRIADTRNADGLFGGPAMTAGSTRSFAIPASGCSIPSTAQAYSLNVTVVPAGPLGYLSLWPTGQDQPFVSTLNSSGGIVVANAAIVPAGAGGAVSVYVTDATNVILDINGYFEASGSYDFYPAPPCRVADTRGAVGPFGGPSMSGGQSRDFAVPSSGCNIPPTASAYSLNVTVVPAGFLGYLSTWPAGQPQPNVSTLNSWTGKVVANAALVPAGANESISVYVSNPTDVILDIDGYFGPPGNTGALQFYPLTPCRVADTRNADGPLGGPEMEGATARSFPVPSSACGVPASAAAYSLNVTVVPDGPLYYLTTWPTGLSQPLVSTLNSFDGSVLANAAIVPAGTGGAISVYVTNPAHVILDINGYFAP